MAAPVLSQVVYNGTQIRANFTYEDTQQQDFLIGLFQGTSASPTQTAPSGPLVAILPNPQMNTTDVWSVAIAAVVGGVTGGYSNRIAVIVGAPQNISVIGDASGIVLTWSPPAGAIVAYGARVSLFNTATAELLDNANFAASPGAFRPIGGFNPAISYGVKLAGANTTNSYGPNSQLIPVIQTVPVFSALDYTITAGVASLTANSSTSNPDNLLGLYVYAEGSLYASAIAGAPGNFVLLTLQQPLAPELTYHAYLAYTVAGGGTRGPLSNELPVLVEPATLSAVAYDGQNLSAAWNNGVGTPPPTGGYVQINGASGAVASGNTLGTNIVISSPPLVANTPYTLTVNVQRGASLGPLSASLAVLTYLAAPMAVAYDGQNIRVTWNAIGGSDVTGVVIALIEDGAIVQTQPGGNRQSLLAATLSPAGTYDIRLQTVGDRTIGPLGAAVPVISVMPRVTGASYAKSGSTSSVAVSWNASEISSGNGVTGYLVQLYENGAPLGAPVSAPGSTTDHLTVNLQNVLDTSKTHSVSVQATGSKSTGAVGKLSPIITASAAFVSVAYDGANVTAEWTPVGQEGVSGYQVSVGGTTQTTSLTTIRFPFTATSANPLISVVVLGAAAMGPAATTTLLTSTATVNSTSFDGAILTVVWTAGTPSPAYVVEVLEGTDRAASQMSTALEATLAVALSPSATYSVAVRPASVDGIMIGPRSTTVPVISVVPRVTGASYVQSGSTSSVAVSWNASEISSGNGVTGYLVQLYENGAPLGNPTPAAGSTTDHVTVNLQNVLDTAKSHSVSVQTTGSKSTGAVGKLSPIITASAAFVSVAYDGANVTAEWTAVGQEGVSGYRVSVGGTTQTTSLTTIRFPFTATSANPLISVVVLGAAAMGPAATTMLLTSTATVNSTSFDGAMLTVVWTAGTPSPAYVVEVLEGTDRVASQMSMGLQVTLPVALSLSATYSVAVRPASTDGIVIGPRSTVAPVIVATPSISGVAYDGANVTGSVTAPGGVSLDSTTMMVSLYANGIAVGVPVAASGGKFMISASGTAGAGLTVRAQLTGLKSNITIRAPLSLPVPVLTVTPVIDTALLSNDGSQWTISAAWSLPESDSATGSFTVALKQAGTTLQSWNVSGNLFSQAAPAFDASKTLDLVVTPNGNFGNGPSSAAATFVPTSIGPVTSVAEGDRLTVTWTDPAGTSFTGHRLRFVQQVGAAWLTIAVSEIVTATTAFIQLPSPLIDPQAIVGVTIDAATGTAWTRANHINPVIVQTPRISSIAFDSSGSLRIDWSAVSGAGRYKVRFSMANAVALTKNPTTNTLTLSPAELPASGIYDVTVQAFASAANDDVSGPVCAPLPAVVLPPPNIGVAYDGRTARVTWEPIDSPAIIGYLTTILNAATPVGTAVTIGPAASIPVAYAPANNYNVIVQALTSAGAGQPSAQAALFQSGWYLSTASNQTSYIKPAANAAMPSYDIVIYLANIFSTYVSSGLPTDPPFVMSTAAAPYSYKLTMPATSAVWSFNADSIRSGILTAYQALLSSLVGLQVTPLGWRMVQDAISRAMPQTFAETLYYAYSFAPGDGYIDLKPGMLLRADFESYQYLGPDQTVSAYVDGFVTSSSAVYEIGSYVTPNDQWLNGFDAFLSLVTQSGSTVPTPQSTGANASGGGGIVDLYYGQFRKSYVRLVYPPQILGDSTAEARPAFNVAVLAANDYPSIVIATGNLRNTQPLPNGVAVTYLRGRTIISACIRVWLDEQPLVVPVGTSVGNLLENMGRRPPIVIPQSGNPGIPLSGIVVERSIGYAVTDPSGYSVSKTVPIRLDWNQGMAYSATTDWLNLPLLAGDRIITRGNE